MNLIGSEARVVVPATSANLGPGFDSLGLALDLHDVVDAGIQPAGLDVTVEGIGADDLPRDEAHLVVRAMRAAFSALGADPGGLWVRCTNAVPHGRGLGSSAAAIVAGILAARALAGAPADDDAVLALATRLEGHPDNVASCLLGGLTIAWTSPDRVRAVRTDVHPDVRPVVLVPAVSLSTEAARGLLPASVPHDHAVRNAGRAALLVEALTRRPDLLFDATEDALHQAYREPAMPDTLALVRELRARGLAAAVSGAGPSVLVMATGDREVPAPAGWDVLSLRVDRRGAATSRPDAAGDYDMIATRRQG